MLKIITLSCITLVLLLITHEPKKQLIGVSLTEILKDLDKSILKSPLIGKYFPKCDLDASFPQMVKIPGFKQTWHIVPDCSHFSRERIAMVLGLYYEMWVREFGDPKRKVLHAIDELVIHWGTKKKLLDNGYTIKGEPISNGVAGGLALTPSMIWVWIGNSARICDNSFVHEMVHISNRAINGKFDPDHEGEKFSGWTKRHTKFIKETNDLLCMLGL